MLGGAYYGLDKEIGIPESWKEVVAFGDLIETYAEELYRMVRTFLFLEIDSRS
jgi:hypothetical protein